MTLWYIKLKRGGMMNKTLKPNGFKEWVITEDIRTYKTFSNPFLTSLHHEPLD
jgi:hypothetical protein